MLVKLLSEAILLASLIISATSSPIDVEQNGTCVYANIAPTLDPSEMTQLASPDGTALAHVSGYVRDIGPLSAEVFLPFQFQSLKARGGKHRSEVVFVSDCSQMTIKVGLTEHNEKVIDGIELNFMGKEKVTKTCSTRNLRTVYGEDKHYSCRKHSVYPCYANSSDHTYMQVAEINLNLEFETGRDPSKAEPGHYSTSADVCKG